MGEPTLKVGRRAGDDVRLTVVESDRGNWEVVGDECGEANGSDGRTLSGGEGSGAGISSAGDGERGSGGERRRKNGRVGMVVVVVGKEV